MKSVTVRQLQVNLTTLLRDLPFKITRYGRVIAVVSAEGPQPKVKKVKEEIEEIKEKPKATLFDSPFKDAKLCKHGAAVGLCKHGCKK